MKSAMFAMVPDGKSPPKNRKRSDGVREYSTDEMSTIIDQYIHHERNRKILKLRYLDGLTYEKIAEHPEIDLTRNQVRNIIYKSQAVLLRHLK